MRSKWRRTTATTYNVSFRIWFRICFLFDLEITYETDREREREKKKLRPGDRHQLDWQTIFSQNIVDINTDLANKKWNMKWWYQSARSMLVDVVNPRAMQLVPSWNHDREKDIFPCSIHLPPAFLRIKKFSRTYSEYDMRAARWQQEELLLIY